MPTLKLQNFLGEVHKTSPELLPANAGQEAFNVKLYSGDLLPYTKPVVITNANRAGNIQTIHALYDPDTEDQVWLSWEDDVDIVIPSFNEYDNQRFYYSGDGVPKVSDYSLAIDGSGAYPVSDGYYELGLPLPSVKLESLAVAAYPIVAEFYERNSEGISTFYGSRDHNFTTGNIIAISDFRDESFNLRGVYVTVINDTDFSYFNPGDTVVKTSSLGSAVDARGEADFVGNAQIRNYIYTWVTPWNEESIPSLPSNRLYVKEGQTINVSDLPEIPPSGRNFIRGIRLYRSVVSVSGSDYFSLGTLWFPTATTKILRDDNVSTVTLEYPHNFVVEDRFKLSGCTNSSFDIDDGVVLEVIDRYSFKYSQVGSDESVVEDTAGTVYHDISQFYFDPAVYWGFNDYGFKDNFLVDSLGAIVPSENYDKPPPNLNGLKLAGNNILIGFFGNKLCFSESGNYHAWPEKYRLTFESDIVSVEAVTGYILVLTEDYPYIVSGNDPAITLVTRFETPYPCLSKKSVVSTENGVVWATHGGLAAYQRTTGVTLITSQIYDWDTWKEDLDPETIIGHYYEGKYFGSYANGSFIFEQQKEAVGSFVSISYKFNAAYTDRNTGIMYYTAGTDGDIYEWDNKDQLLSPLEWKSKVFILETPVNMGAARVVADYAANSVDTDRVIGYNQTLADYNQQIWDDNKQLGTIGWTQVNTHPINGDSYTRNYIEVDSIEPVVFRLWVDKILIFEMELSSDEVFRLPVGYKSDTFEIGVSGSARIRAIYMGETPSGLKVA